MIYNPILYHIQFIENICKEIDLIINKYNTYIKYYYILL